MMWLLALKSVRLRVCVCVRLWVYVCVCSGWLSDGLLLGKSDCVLVFGRGFGMRLFLNRFGRTHWGGCMNGCHFGGIGLVGRQEYGVG